MATLRAIERYGFADPRVTWLRNGFVVYDARYGPCAPTQYEALNFRHCMIFTPGGADEGLAACGAEGMPDPRPWLVGGSRRR